jgi:cell division protein DivIC
MLTEQRQLRSDCRYYTLRIVEDSTRLSELRKDASSLEKFAREQYLMKKDNEDVFVIVK